MKGLKKDSGVTKTKIKEGLKRKYGKLKKNSERKRMVEKERKKKINYFSTISLKKESAHTHTHTPAE